MWLMVAATSALLELSLEAGAAFVSWRSTTSGVSGFISGNDRVWRGFVSLSLWFGMVPGVEVSASGALGCRTALDSLEPIGNVIEYVL
jgi:hypothetical protein